MWKLQKGKVSCKSSMIFSCRPFLAVNVSIYTERSSLNQCCVCVEVRVCFLVWVRLSILFDNRLIEDFLMNDDTTECWLKKLLEKKFRLPIKHHGHERIAGWMDGSYG